MFFDYYAFSEGSCKNVEKDGVVVGFELKTRITYYRGIPLSMIDNVEIRVDNRLVDKTKIHFTPNGEDWFTLAEMETVSAIKWEFGEEATIFAEQEGGLSQGKHKVALRTSITVAYAPLNFMGERSRIVEIQ